MSNRSIAVRAAGLALLAAACAFTTTTAAPARKAAAKPKSAASDSARIATVIDRKITRKDLGPPPPGLESIAAGDAKKLAALRSEWEGKALAGLVLGVLLDRFGREQAIAPTPVELSEVLAVLVQAAPRTDAAPPDTTDPQVRSAANALVARFRIHEALWRIHGGRVLIDPRSGPLPFDSYRRLLEAEQKAGSFRLPAAWEKRFWATFAEDSARGFVSPEVATASMTRPWWRTDPGAP